MRRGCPGEEWLLGITGHLVLSSEKPTSHKFLAGSLTCQLRDYFRLAPDWRMCGRSSAERQRRPLSFTFHHREKCSSRCEDQRRTAPRCIRKTKTPPSRMASCRSD